MDAQQEFARMIRVMRIESGLTQEKMAEIVGISTTYFREIEKGKHIPNWLIWFKICLALNLSISEMEEIIRKELYK